MKKLQDSFRRFMLGRYGMDRLNSTLLWVSLGISLLGVLIRVPPVRLSLTAVSYLLLGWLLFRALSRKTYKRYQENRRFLLWLDRIRDREHRYYQCPRCRQIVRVPRNKGKIAITCPKCREKFTRKT